MLLIRQRRLAVAHARWPPRLGEGPEADYEQTGYQLQPGEVLVIFTEGVRDAADAQGSPLGEVGVAKALLGRLRSSGRGVGGRGPQPFGGAGRPGRARPGPDRTVLVIKRKATA